VPKTAEELKLPVAVMIFARSTAALILVTGKTGSGKSTTWPAMVDTSLA